VRTWIALALLGLCFVYLAGCARVSNGTFWIREAPLAEGWPELTPIGAVEVKAYPDTREALVTSDPESIAGGGMEPMFRSLFQHIKSREVSMTTPVAMGYDEGNTADMSSMAFLYRRPDQGVAETHGAVTVADVPGRTYASIGVRGDYTNDNYVRGLAELDAWLDANADQWRVDGPPRYLGYNGPFTLWFMKYGEVQRPVIPAGG
jgi:hypothetical protein